MNKINKILSQVVLQSQQMRDVIFKHFSLQLQNIQHWDKAYGVSFNNLDLNRQTFCTWYCVKDFSISLITDITLHMLLAEPQISEEAEFNFMVICLPAGIFHCLSWTSWDQNDFLHNYDPTWQQTGKRVSHGKLHLFSGADKEFHLLVVCFVLNFDGDCEEICRNVTNVRVLWITYLPKGQQ